VDYNWLMAGRIVASLTHGAFFGLGATVAAALVEPRRRSAAIALMFSGLTLANVLGVPAGALIGQAAGWRATFWAVSTLGVLGLAGILLLVPRALVAPDHAFAQRGWRILLRARLLGALALTGLGFGGIFTTLTYLSPLLQVEAHFSPSQVNALLLLFGLGLTLGNVLGGWAADRWPQRAMPMILSLLAAIEVVLHFALSAPVIVVASVFLWGVAAFATAPGLQSRVLDEAGDAPALASTLNIGAFNLGNAAAAWIGARALDAGLSLSDLPLMSAALALAALTLVLVLDRSRPRTHLRLIENSGGHLGGVKSAKL
jgi:MFS transporter, DHA1 family, inner membrane transport protein